MRIPIRWPNEGESITCPDGNVYYIGKKIGEGAFSVVLACADEWDNQLAIKILKPEGKLFDVVRKSYEKERELLLRFRHPNVTHIFNAFMCENLFYIITERCAYTVGDLIQSEDFSAEGWIKPMARSLLQALSEIHNMGYVHRDIHLGNVFTSVLKNDYLPSDSSQVIRFKLGDFGVSRLISEAAPESTMAMWLRPPEVLFPSQFSPLDCRVDIYQVGLLFLQMLCKRQLEFSIEDARNGVPKELALQQTSCYREVLAKSLSQAPADRYPSAIAFWQDLRMCNSVNR